MKFHTAIPLFLAMLPVAAEESVQARTVSSVPHPLVVAPPLSGVQAGWLGVDLTKPDHGLISHLPALPPGVGFLVKSVHDDGPAALAGLKEADLVWKFDEQLLVNEAQLSTLLRMHEPGEKITLTVFRRGSQMEIPVELGTSPPPRPGEIDLAAEEAVFHSDQGPMRVVNLAEREAYITNAEGRAVVRKVDDGYWLTIRNADGEVVFDDAFDRGHGKNSELHDSIPSEWKRRAFALRRGLEHALDGKISPQRQPRPRVVPPNPR